jgi:hypothetical protein
VDGPGVAALRAWPVNAALGPATVVVPAAPAQRWIMAILDRDLLGVIPGMIADDAVLDAVASNAITTDQCRAAARAAVAAASGMRWWEATKLVHLSVFVPWLAGDLILSGVDSGHVSLGGWCAATWRVLTRDRDTAGVAKIDWEVSRPPPGVRPDELFDPQRAAAAFGNVTVPD